MPYFVDEIKKILPNKKVFCDIGASEGHYSEIASETMPPESKIFIFEPRADPKKWYKNIIKEARKKNIKVIVSNVAVSNVTGDDKIRKDTLSKDIPHKNKYKPLKVNTVTLDEFFEDKNKYPDIVKIDTEGWEVNILEGAKKIIKKNNTHFFIEVHWEYLRLQNQNGNQILEFFDKENYEVNLIKFHNGKPFDEIAGIRHRKSALSYYHIYPKV